MSPRSRPSRRGDDARLRQPRGLSRSLARALTVGVCAAALAALSSCTVDIPTAATAYTCAEPPCPDVGPPCTDATTCPSGTPCQTATCVHSTCGLETRPDKSTCDDGEPCTTNDSCLSGVCKAGPNTDCGDDNPCTTDSCAAGAGCVHEAASVPCDDGDACTTGDTCANKACVSGAKADCDDGEPCTTDSCSSATGCVYTKGTAPCDDGDACTEGDKCGGGTCQPGKAATCDDGQACTDDSCNKATGCVHTANDGACDDGEPCTDDSCNKATGCVATANKIACDDGDACTKGDQCGGGTCLSGPAVSCDDGESCTDDSCNKATGCVFAPNDDACDDGDACTLGEGCVGGVCGGSKPVDCDDGKDCTVDLCDKAGSCSNTLTTGPCDDGDGCTVGETCATGACFGGVTKTCDDGNACTTDSCDKAVGCVFTPTSGGCDDGDPCTTKDTCAKGVCAGTLAATLACCGKVGGTLTGGHCARTPKLGGPQHLVPDGVFWMGCNSAKDSKCSATEKPQHVVDLSGFWLDLHEVTVAEFKACVSAGACKAPATPYPTCTWNAAGKDQHPVNCVTWDAAAAYCAWAGGGLPTEAQWEKAARGGCESASGGTAGCQSAAPTYPWGEVAPTCDYGVIFDGLSSGCGKAATWPVGQKPKGAGPYGHVDLIGNVLEWVADGWDPSWYAAYGPQSWPANPLQSQKTTERCLRGGSLSAAGSALRAGHRAHFAATKVVAYVGFRCAAPAQ